MFLYKVSLARAQPHARIRGGNWARQSGAPVVGGGSPLEEDRAEDSSSRGAAEAARYRGNLRPSGPWGRGVRQRDGADQDGRKFAKGLYIMVLQSGGAKAILKVGVIH